MTLALLQRSGTELAASLRNFVWIKKQKTKNSRLGLNSSEERDIIMDRVERTVHFSGL